MLISSIGLVTIINCQTFFTCTYCCQNRMNPRLVDFILKGSIFYMYKPLIITKPVQLCLTLDICMHFELFDPMHRGYNIIAPQTSLLRLVSCKRWVIGFTLPDWSGGKGAFVRLHVAYYAWVRKFTVWSGCCAIVFVWACSCVYPFIPTAYLCSLVRVVFCGSTPSLLWCVVYYHKRILWQEQW